MDFTPLVKELEAIQAEWDGDNAGSAEDRALIAAEIISNLKYLGLI